MKSKRNKILLYLFAIGLLITACQENQKSTPGQTKLLWSKDGKIEAIGVYTDSVLNGFAVCMEKNNSIDFLNFNKNGMLHGPFINCDSFNRIKSIRMYENDFLNGYSFFFDTSGKLYESEFYYKNELVERIKFNSLNGKIVSYFSKNKIKSIALYYFDNGTLESIYESSPSDSSECFYGRSYYRNGALKTVFRGCGRIKNNILYYNDSTKETISNAFRYISYKLILSQNSMVFTPFIKYPGDKIGNYNISLTTVIDNKDYETQYGRDNNNHFVLNTYNKEVTLKYKICDRLGCTEVLINLPPITDDFEGEQVLSR